jgi:hypothetical protein
VSQQAATMTSLAIAFEIVKATPVDSLESPGGGYRLLGCRYRRAGNGVPRQPRIGATGNLQLHGNDVADQGRTRSDCQRASHRSRLLVTLGCADRLSLFGKTQTPPVVLEAAARDCGTSPLARRGRISGHAASTRRARHGSAKSPETHDSAAVFRDMWSCRHVLKYFVNSP